METAPAKPRILRLFISYAHEDPNVQVVKKQILGQTFLKAWTQGNV